MEANPTKNLAALEAAGRAAFDARLEAEAARAAFNLIVVARKELGVQPYLNNQLTQEAQARANAASDRQRTTAVVYAYELGVQAHALGLWPMAEVNPEAKWLIKDWYGANAYGEISSAYDDGIQAAKDQEAVK